MIIDDISISMTNKNHNVSERPDLLLGLDSNPGWIPEKSNSNNRYVYEQYNSPIFNSRNVPQPNNHTLQSCYDISMGPRSDIEESSGLYQNQCNTMENFNSPSLYHVFRPHDTCFSTNSHVIARTDAAVSITDISTSTIPSSSQIAFSESLYDSDHRRRRRRPPYCSNCGSIGHSSKLCGIPTLSCGIILFRRNALEDDPKNYPFIDHSSINELIRRDLVLKDIDYFNLENGNLLEERKSICCARSLLLVFFVQNRV